MLLARPLGDWETTHFEKLRAGQGWTALNWQEMVHSEKRMDAEGWIATEQREMLRCSVPAVGSAQIVRGQKKDMLDQQVVAIVSDPIVASWEKMLHC